MIETKTLDSAVGIQRQGIIDKTETTPIGTGSALIVGSFNRGRTDKPFKVTLENYQALLGYDPTNPDYNTVEDALKQGISEVWVMRTTNTPGEAVVPRELKAYHGMVDNRHASGLFVSDNELIFDVKITKGKQSEVQKIRDLSPMKARVAERFASGFAPLSYGSAETFLLDKPYFGNRDIRFIGAFGDVYNTSHVLAGVYGADAYLDNWGGTFNHVVKSVSAMYDFDPFVSSHYHSSHSYIMPFDEERGLALINAFPKLYKELLSHTEPSAFKTGLANPDNWQLVRDPAVISTVPVTDSIPDGMVDGHNFLAEINVKEPGKPFELWSEWVIRYTGPKPTESDF